MEKADAVQEAVKDETDRAVALCHGFMAVYRASAAKIRKAGEYQTRIGIWPFGHLVTRVRPGFEREARIADHCVDALQSIERGLLLGWDARKLISKEQADEKITEPVNAS